MYVVDVPVSHHSRKTLLLFELKEGEYADSYGRYWYRICATIT